MIDQKFKRINGNHDIKVDVRIICSTARDINNEISNYNFRSDFIVNIIENELKINDNQQIILLAHNKSLLNYVKLQVSAAEIASEGIAAEYNSGSGRTTLEVIQSNSLLLSAQISLADSERNFILSKFNLLKSVGLLNSEYLKIK